MGGRWSSWEGRAPWGRRIGVLFGLCLSLSSCERRSASSERRVAQPVSAPPAAESEPNAQPAPAVEPWVLLELFTSEGCSSCPPADRVLSKLRDRYAGQNVAILSYHVDYWNDLGWRDPFSRPAFSDRQRRYAAAFGTGRIYTPQLIVEGTTQFVGSAEERAVRAVYEALKEEPECAVALRPSPGWVSSEPPVYDYDVEGAPEGTTLVLTRSRDSEPVEVSRGENSGRTLTHAAVVREQAQRPTHGEASGSWAPRAEPGDVLLAWVQATDTMRILCGTHIAVTSSRAQ